MNLGHQLIVAALMMTIVALVHGLGIVAIARLLRLEQEELRRREVDFTAFMLLVAIALCLFALHLSEIVLFALFYMAVGALESFETAMFFSASAYSTLANTVGGFPDQWRLLGAIEGLVGFLMIGWTTAVFVGDVSLLLRRPD